MVAIEEIVSFSHSLPKIISNGEVNGVGASNLMTEDQRAPQCFPLWDRRCRRCNADALREVAFAHKLPDVSSLAALGFDEENKPSCDGKPIRSASI